MAVDFKTFTLDAQQLKKTEDKIDYFQKQIDELQQFQNILFKDVNKLKSNYPLPTISLVEIHPTEENKKGVSFPHIRGTCYINYLGKKDRFSIYVGPLEDYKDGANDLKAFQVAIDKSFNYLKKKFPSEFK